MAASKEHIAFLQTFVESLNSDNDLEPLEAMGSLTELALALGPRTTREVIVPLLYHMVPSLAQDVLFVMTSQLAQFVPLCGGALHVDGVLEVLELMCMQQESLLHEKAGESLVYVLRELTPEQISSTGMELVRRLVAHECFQSNVAVCRLFSAVYPTAMAQQRQELIQMYIGMAEHDIPLVKQAVLHNLPALFSCVETSVSVGQLLPVLSQLAVDLEPSTRADAFYACVRALSTLPLAESAPVVVPIVKQLTLDKDWLIRFECARHWIHLSTVCSPEIAANYLVPCFISLLQDSEMVVRKFAARAAPVFISLLSRDVVRRQLLTPLQTLCTDPAPDVRGYAGRVLCLVAPLLGRTVTFSKILPLLEKLLRDSEDEVRRAALRWFSVPMVIGTGELAGHPIMEAFVECLSAQDWRVRRLALYQSPFLARTLGGSWVQQSLRPHLLRLLTDRAYEVRFSAGVALSLVAHFTETYPLPDIVEALMPVLQHSYYLYRNSALEALTCVLRPSYIVAHTAHRYRVAGLSGGGDVFKSSTLDLLWTFNMLASLVAQQPPAPERLSAEFLSQLEDVQTELEALPEDALARRFSWITAENCIDHDVFALLAPEIDQLLELPEAAPQIVNSSVSCYISALSDPTPNVRCVSLMTLRHVIPMIQNRGRFNAVRSAVMGLGDDDPSVVELRESLLLCINE